MYFGIVLEDRKAFGSSFVYSIVYTTVDKTGFTTATYTIRTIMNIGALPRRCRPCSLTESYITPGQNTTPGRAGALFHLRIMRAGLKSWKFVEIGKDRGEFGIETLKGVL